MSWYAWGFAKWSYMVSNDAVWGWGYSGYLVRPHANYVACEVLAQAGAVDGN
jgi:hypothetical protein